MAKGATSKELIAELKQQKLRKFYLFTGEENGEKDKMINKIVSIYYKGEKKENKNVRWFHIENGEFDNAVDYALSSSMFSTESICVMQNVNKVISGNVAEKKKEKLKYLFLELVQNMPAQTILIMTTDENKAPTILPKELLQQTGVFQFWRHFENDLYNYILRCFKNYHLEIDDKAVSLLINLVGRDIRKIDNAVDLIVTAGELGPISEEIVQNYVFESKDITVFDFCDSFFKKDPQAYQQLEQLLVDGVAELQLLALLVRNAEKIEQFYLLKKTGRNDFDIFREIKIFTKAQNDFKFYLKKYSQQQIRQLFVQFYETDKKIKSGELRKDFLSNPLVLLMNFSFAS